MTPGPFDPRYTLGVETAGGGNVKVELPYAVSFEIRRATLASSQTATFRLENLGSKLRDAIQKDWFNLADVRAVQFSAGYGDGPAPMIFNGTMKQAQSHRPSGGLDFLTEIEAFDGGPAFANGYSLQTIAGGTQFSDLIKSLAKDLPGVSADVVLGKIEGETKRSSTYAGNTWDYIFQLSNGLAFVDNGQLKILNPKEYVGKTIPLIDSGAGLLGTPVRFLNMLRLSLLFDPRFTLGQLVELRSATLAKFNGQYKVVGVTHRGTISRAGVDAERTTELTIWDGLSSAGSWEEVGP